MTSRPCSSIFFIGVFLAGCAWRSDVPVQVVPRTLLEIRVEEPGLADLRITKASGEPVRILLNAVYLGQGSQQVPWDGLDQDGHEALKGDYRWDLELRHPDFELERVLARAGSARGQVLSPAGLAVTEGEEGPSILVVDSGNGRVQQLSLEGDFLREIRPSGSEADRFQDPWGLAQRGGEIFVADRDAKKLFKFARYGDFRFAIDSVGPSREHFTRPQALAFDMSGKLLVADPGADRVFVIDPLGRLAFSLGGFGSGNGFFMKPQGVCADAQGRIYVADTGNHRIQQFSASGSWLRTFTLSQASHEAGVPTALAFGNGLLVVADAETRNLVILDSDGRPLSRLSSEKVLPEGLGNPVALALSADGRLFVSDGQGHRVLSFHRNDRLIRASGSFYLAGR